MKKKLLLLSLMVLSLFSMFSFVNAEELMNVNIYSEAMGNVGTDTIYKSSEHKSATIPFINSISGMKVILDTDIAHSGITMAQKEIEVLGNLKGLHMMYNTDSITIKGKIDYPIIVSQNVIIEGEITGDTVIWAPNIVIKDSAKIHGDILVSTQNLKIEGDVYGSVIAHASNECTITGKVGKSLRVSTKSLNVENGTVGGDIFVKTDADMSKLLEKYPNAVVEIDSMSENESEVKDIIITGVTTVVIFTAVGYIFLRKDDNMFTKALNKIKGKSVNVVLSGAAVLLPSILVAMLLVIASILGLWIIGVPLLIVYIAYIVACCMLSVMIVGAVIFEAIKYNVIKKYEENALIKKLGLLFAIYLVLYALTVIPFISTYAIMALCTVSTGIVTVSLFGKNK